MKRTKWLHHVAMQVLCCATWFLVLHCRTYCSTALLFFRFTIASIFQSNQLWRFQLMYAFNTNSHILIYSIDSSSFSLGMNKPFGAYFPLWLRSNIVFPVVMENNFLFLKDKLKISIFPYISWLRTIRCLSIWHSLTLTEMSNM